MNLWYHSSMKMRFYINKKYWSKRDDQLITKAIRYAEIRYGLHDMDLAIKLGKPNDKYWGASTQRSKKYFDIGEFLVRPILIKSIAIIKKAAAIVHVKEKQILPNISKAIVKASNEVIDVKLD